MYKILLIYGHVLSHRVLSDLIHTDRSLDLVAEAASVHDALPLILQHAPDVVLLDISVPEHNGLEMFCDLKQALPEVQVLIVNGSDQADRIGNFVRLGCQGYLPYTTSSEHVLHAIKAIAKGEPYRIVSKPALQPAQDHKQHECLSMRELQVLLKLIKGQAVNAVAEELSIAPGSVSVFRSKILKKMNMRSNAALIHYALDHHLIH